ncbi:MAG: hypothetical protein M3526_05390, partial [Actinomycetota bacterium]|nr:hypothetical protein [Actinomycetota bacterium]
GESWMATRGNGEDPHGLQPDGTIRKVVGVLNDAREHLDRMSGNELEVAVLRDTLHIVDAELGWAAWQVGVLKTRVNEERRAKDEFAARLQDLASSNGHIQGRRI